jgi:peroxiredoxin
VPRVPSRPPQPSLLGRPLPDLTLPDARGGTFALRQFVGRGPLVLFFYLLNGSPG